jgi:hypothetical protein
MRNHFVFGICGLFGLVLLAGCVAPQAPYALKPATKPVPVYCFDTVGHTTGAKPFILGGTCSCTPSDEVLADYKKNGHFAQDMTLQQLIDQYHKAGIKTALDHQSCNNLCQWGPHVIKGGKCMVPPTPATYNFEEVRFNIRYVPAAKTTAQK